MAKHGAKCPKCGNRLDYDSAVGDRVVCAHCQASLVVPATAKAPSTPADPLIGETLGQFEILELLGRGGMGAVYKARQASLGRFVAIKVLPEHLATDDSFVERFNREARSAAAVRHPNIIEVFDVGQAMGHEYIAMEFIEGETLGDVLKREGRLAPDRALDIMRQTASALAGAHECRILHRDIKPSNILLDAKGRVKVADFGLAKHEGTDVSVTVTGQALGTPLYMPPEAARGVPLDARGDLYSLGATFYQALSGRPPFEGTTGAELVAKHLEATPPTLHQLVPGVPPALSRIIHRLLRKRPADRYSSADKLLQALSRIEAHVAQPPPAVAPPTSHDRTRTLVDRPERPPTAHRGKPTSRQKHVGGVSVPRVRLPLILGAAGCILLLLLLLLLLSPWRAKPPTKAKGTTTSTTLTSADLAKLEHNASIVFKNIATCLGKNDPDKAKEYLDRLTATYGKTKFVAAHAAEIAAFRKQIDAALQRRIDAHVKGTAKPQPPKPQPPKPQPGQPIGAVKVTLRRALDVKTNGIAAIAPVANQLAWAGAKHSGGFNVAQIDALDKPQWIRARPSNTIYCLAWGGGRRSLAACGDPHGAAVWDRTNVVCKLGYGGQKSTIHAVAVSPDATRLASGSSDKSVWLWDIRTSKPVWKREAVSCYDSLAFTPDGRLLACGGYDAKVHLLRVDTGKTERELTGGEGRIYALAVSRDGATLAAAGGTTVRLWDLATGALRHTLTGHTDHVGTVAFSRDGALVASGGKDATARLWDARTGRLLHTITDHKAAVRTVAFSSAEDLLITAGEDSLRLWDVALVAAAQAPAPPPAEEWTTLPNGWRVGKAVNLGPVINSSAHEGSPSVSADGRTMVFTSNRRGGQGQGDLWASSRPGPDAAWGKPVNLGAPINTGDVEVAPCLSADGLTLVFQCNRAGGQGVHDLWLCTRRGRAQAWGPPVNLGTPVNSPPSESDPCLSTDGLTLIFVRDEKRGHGGGDLWMSSRPSTDAPWGEPANLGAPLNTKDDEQSPSLSADGLTLVFQSNRAGGQGDFDLWMSTRAATTKPFGEPVNLGPSVNSGAGDGGGCLSADRRTLYFTCDRPGGHGHTDIWQAPLLPPGAPLAGPPPDDDERWTAWQDLFDGKTLNGWHVLEGQGREKHGAVYVDDGRIVLEKGDVGTTIAWTGSFPLTDYEVELDAMSVAGRATFCEVLFRAGDHKAALSLGGERGGIIGLRQLDGRPAHDNATTRKLALLEGRWYHLRLRVLGNQIIVWADGRRVIDLATAGHELGGWNLPPHRFLMQTHRHPKSAFRAIRLRRLKPEPPRDVEGRIRLFDGMTLEGWRVIKGPGQFGAVRVDDGRLILEKGANPTAVVRDGAFPTTHYEVTLDLMRIEGSGSVSVAFPVGEMTCNLWLGTHGARALAGLGNVDGKPAYENDTKRDIQFETDRWYTARIRVIDQRIEAWLDGRKVTELTTEGHKLFASAPGAPAPFRLSTWISAAAFRNIVVRRLRPALPPPDDGGRWTAWEALFDGKSLQGWQARPEKGRSIDVRPATQEIENGGGALVWTGDFPTTGYEVSMEARRIGGNDFANLRFPVDAMSCTLVVKPDMVSLNEVRGPGIAAHAVDVRAPRDVSQWHTYRLRVLADRIGVWVDEKPVIDFRRAGHTFRCFQGVAPFSFYTFMGQGAYRNIRLRRLDVEPRAVPGKPAP